MIRLEHLNINVGGDGEQQEAILDLSKDVKRPIVTVASVSIRGPNPLPDITAEVVGENNQVMLKFSTPLQKFDTNNGYTIFLSVGVK